MGPELGIRERGSVLSTVDRWVAAQRMLLSPSFPALLAPSAGARGGEPAGASAEAAKRFPNRKPSGCGAPGRGRAFPGCLRRESPGRSRRLVGMRPGQSPGRGWAAGRGGHCGLERLPVTKQDPPCGSLPDPQRLAALLKGRPWTLLGSPPLAPPGKLSAEVQGLCRDLRRGWRGKQSNKIVQKMQERRVGKIH